VTRDICAPWSAADAAVVGRRSVVGHGCSLLGAWRCLPGRHRHRHVGLNRTVGWGFDITNFVFWIGIGHAGTLISASSSSSGRSGAPRSTARPRR
jgi:hypothetical protein